MRFLHHTSKISKRYTDLFAHYRALTNIVNILCMLINVFITCVFDVYLIAIQNRTYSNHDHQMSIITLADCFPYCYCLRVSVHLFGRWLLYLVIS